MEQIRFPYINLRSSYLKNIGGITAHVPCISSHRALYLSLTVSVKYTERTRCLALADGQTDRGQALNISEDITEYLCRPGGILIPKNVENSNHTR